MNSEPTKINDLNRPEDLTSEDVKIDASSTAPSKQTADVAVKDNLESSIKIDKPVVGKESSQALNLLGGNGANAQRANIPKERPSFRNLKTRRGGKRGDGSRRGRSSHERARPEYEHKVINVRRVTRVVAGGRRFSFSVALVAGNRKGSVGVGIGKGGDTALAIEKALRNAKKNMIKLKLTKEMSIPHEVKEKFSSARILIMPARGRGVIAGSSVRNVLQLAGIKDVSAKILSGSKNKLNIARVAVKALTSFGEPKKKVIEINKSQTPAPLTTEGKTQGEGENKPK